jgi:hypothetical protein
MEENVVGAIWSVAAGAMWSVAAGAMCWLLMNIIPHFGPSFDHFGIG